jgi:hypothetical protein
MNTCFERNRLPKMVILVEKIKNYVKLKMDEKSLEPKSNLRQKH